MVKKVCDGCGRESPVKDKSNELVYPGNHWLHIKVRQMGRYRRDNEAKVLLCRNCFNKIVIWNKHINCHLNLKEEREYDNG